MGKLETIERLSLNQMTTNQFDLKEAIEGCAKQDIPYIGIWRQKLAEYGLKESKRMVTDAGLKVSSVCRGGMFPSNDVQQMRDENMRAIEEAAELNAEVLVLVCGPPVDKNIASARETIAEEIDLLIPHAKAHGVQLGIEPLHPMYAADRSAIVTLAEANAIASKYSPEEIGVVIDVYHVWWDPDLYNQIDKAKGRILGFHVCDWLVPTPDMLNGRGMMGDGVIEIPKIRKAVEAAGYNGPIEVEIFNEDLWSLKGEDVLTLMKDRYLEYC